MKPSWRRSRFWLRRPRLASDSVVLRRSVACSVARLYAVACTRSSASTTRRTSSLAPAGTVTVGGGVSASPAVALRTASGSCSPASRLASWARVASGRAIERDAAVAR